MSLSTTNYKYSWLSLRVSYFLDSRSKNVTVVLTETSKLQSDRDNLQTPELTAQSIEQQEKVEQIDERISNLELNTLVLSQG